MGKQVWLATNRQDKERRILSEEKAFDLDKRLWRLETWSCTSGHEKPAVSNETVVIEVVDSTVCAIKCEECGAYHPISHELCLRDQHVRFNDIKRFNDISRHVG